MAITFPAAAQISVADNPSDLANGFLTPSRHNQGCSVAGLGTNQLLYSTGATTLAQSANLTYSDTLVNSGPGVQVGTGSGTSTGAIIGQHSSGFYGLWPTSVTPSTTNYNIAANSGGIYFMNAAALFQTSQLNFNVGATANSYIRYLEMTPPTGSANMATLFAQDNGGGKTQLMVIFGSGAAIQLAIEV